MFITDSKKIYCEEVINTQLYKFYSILFLINDIQAFGRNATDSVAFLLSVSAMGTLAEHSCAFVFNVLRRPRKCA